MSSIGTSKGILEIGKFAFYVSIPIDLMYTLANNSENMKKLIRKVFFSSIDAMKLVIKYLFFTSLYEFMNEAMDFASVSRAFEIQEGTRLVYNILSAFEVYGTFFIS
ncbi:hypothetical protein AAG906_006738 [Vitis piasezkii]